MSENPIDALARTLSEPGAREPDELSRTLNERGTRYVVGMEGYPVAVILTLEEYNHYLGLLDNEAGSQNAELATRLIQAASQSAREQDQFNQRQIPGLPGVKNTF